MKKVFDLDMVAHLFANQSQEEARNSNNSFYFKGDTIYSYGSHFPIAKHILNKNGDSGVLFTTDSYSNSTAKHISITRSACSHLNIIYCGSPKNNHQENIGQFENDIKNCLAGMDRARKLERYIEPAKRVFADCKKYCDFFGLEVPKKIIRLIEIAENGQYAEYLSRERKRIEYEKKIEEQKELNEFNKNLKEWRKGEGHRIYGKITGFDYLRFNGKRIETSQGVEIPVDTAKKSFNYIIKMVKSGGCDNPNFKILNWDLQKITTDNIQIGCHKIQIEEIKMIAKQMNWI